MINEIFKASGLILDHRSTYQVLASLVEEVGELSQEVNIANGGKDKPAGPDGIIGEAIDIIICAVDLIKVNSPKVSEEQMMTILAAKLTKWKRGSLEKLEKENQEHIALMNQRIVPTLTQKAKREKWWKRK